MAWPGLSRATRVAYKNGPAVIEVEAENHLVQLADGKNIAYDRLVIATGSRLYAPVEGAELPGVYNFKSLSAAQNLVERVKSGEAQQALIFA